MACSLLGSRTAPGPLCLHVVEGDGSDGGKWCISAHVVLRGGEGAEGLRVRLGEKDRAASQIT